MKKMGALAYSAEGGTASMESMKQLLAAAATEHISTCYTNYSIPFGGVDFTADMLAVQSAGCDGITGSFVDASNVALAQAVKNAGLHIVAYFGLTAYDEDIVNSATARDALDGDYIGGGINFTTPNGPVNTMLAALKKYDKAYPGGIPDLGLYASYIQADLMIKGLQLAEPSLTRAAFITNLRKVGNSSAGGILPSRSLSNTLAQSVCYPKRFAPQYFS